MHLITPSVGRVVYFHPHDRHPEMRWVDRNQPMAAIVALVNSDTNLNLTVFDQEGNSFAVQNVTLVHDIDAGPIPDAHFAFWMPYQLGQARRAAEADAIQASAAEQTGITGDGVTGVILTADSDLDLLDGGFGDSLDTPPAAAPLKVEGTSDGATDGADAAGAELADSNIP